MLATATFSSDNQDDYYTIEPPTYPDTIALSLNRNSGFTKGDIDLTSTGVQINSSGDYWVSFSAIIFNPETNTGSIVIPVFLVRDDTYVSTGSITQLGSTNTIQLGSVITTNGSGVVVDVTAGTTLSLLASNGGSPDSISAKIISWSISLYKL